MSPIQATADPHGLLRAALDFARVGVPVFPAVPNGKRPLVPHGFLDASTDQLQIMAWWRRWPRANLAVPTGAGSFDVLDVDVHGLRSGYPALIRLNEARLLDGWTSLIATPSGGSHIWFPGSEQGNSSIPSQAVDFRSTGGYALVPPSVIDGVPYEITRRRSSPGAALDWAAVRAFLAPPMPPPRNAPRHLSRGIEPLAAWVSRLPEGQRNTGTFWAACRAVEAGHDDLRALVDSAVAAGLPFSEAARTVSSALRTVSSTQRPHTTPAAPRRRSRSGP